MRLRAIELGRVEPIMDCVDALTPRERGEVIACVRKFARQHLDEIRRRAMRGLDPAQLREMKKVADRFRSRRELADILDEAHDALHPELCISALDAPIDVAGRARGGMPSELAGIMSAARVALRAVLPAGLVDRIPEPVLAEVTLRMAMAEDDDEIENIVQGLLDSFGAAGRAQPTRKKRRKRTKRKRKP